MSAITFEEEAEGKTAAAAFHGAVDAAIGDLVTYSGCIAAKPDFIMIELPRGEDPRQYAQKLVDDCDPRIDDKWGPAGCIKLGPGKWLFFGWAAS